MTTSTSSSSTLPPSGSRASGSGASSNSTTLDGLSNLFTDVSHTHVGGTLPSLTVLKHLNLDKENDSSSKLPPLRRVVSAVNQSIPSALQGALSNGYTTPLKQARTAVTTPIDKPVLNGHEDPFTSAVNGTVVGFDRNTLLVERSGEAFSTDAGISRSLEITNVPEAWIRKQINDFHLRGDLEAYSLPTSDIIARSVILHFQDLRHAALVLQNWSQLFSQHQQFFRDTRIFYAPWKQVGGLGPPSSTIAESDHKGQIVMTMVWTGEPHLATLTAAYDSAYGLCKLYGEVRAFALLRVISPTRAHFRCEFYSLLSQTDMIKSTKIDQFNPIDSNFGLIVSHFKDETPASRTTSFTNLSGTPAISSQMSQIHVSPTKRTTWRGNQLIPSTSVTSMASTFGQPYDDLSMYQYQYQYGASGLDQGGSSQDQWSPTDSYGPSDPLSMGTSLLSRHHRGRNSDDENHRAQAVDIQSIEHGLDVRTTLMIRNIPNKMTADQLKAIVDPHCRGLYDFLYLRLDFASGNNVGYGFINFIDPAYIVPFLNGCVGQPWPGMRGPKCLQVSYATIQGLECLVQKFRNSSVMMEFVGARPKLFYTVHDQGIPAGKQPGDEAPFPEPDNRSKHERSIANAQTIGLFPPRATRSDRDGRIPRSQYDRGTPRAITDEINYHNSRRSGYQQNIMHAGLQMPMGPTAPAGSRDFGPIGLPTANSYEVVNPYQYNHFAPRFMPPRLETAGYGTRPLGSRADLSW